MSGSNLSELLGAGNHRDEPNQRRSGHKKTGKREDETPLQKLQ